jgi:hypothetical protein
MSLRRSSRDTTAWPTLSQIACPTNHGEVLGVDPIQLPGFGFNLGDTRGNVRTGQQLVESLVAANESRPVGPFASHERPLIASRFH